VLLLTDRIPPENRGGAGEIVWRLALALAGRGHDVHVACATENHPFEEVRAGVPTYHLHSRYHERWRAYVSLCNLQVAEPLRRLIARLKPDVVHAHNIHMDLSYHTLVLARRAGCRTLFTSHDVMPFAYTKLSHFVNAQSCEVPVGGYRLPLGYNLRRHRLRYQPLRNLWIRHVLAHYTDVRVAVSHELARAHRENGLPPFSVVHNGIAADDWRASPAAVAALSARLDAAGRRVVLFGGRLTKAKGTQPLLAAFERVLPQVPDALLLVLSAAPLEKQLTPAQQQALGQHIRSAGWLSGEDLAAAYQLAQVVVVPSIIFDSFPTMVLEAMASARPVIATCFGGAKEALVDGETGLLINPLNSDHFADALRRLLLNPENAAQMGQAGYARAAKHFTMAGMAARYEALYS
jgi:glycosyltransferase involved in cell wall biosynthesis